MIKALCAAALWIHVGIGVAMAQSSIDEGKARAALERLVEVSNSSPDDADG